MRYVLMFAGYGWALFGVLMLGLDTNWEVVNNDALPDSTREQAVTSLFPEVMMFMILPGLVVGFVGQRL